MIGFAGGPGGKGSLAIERLDVLRLSIHLDLKTYLVELYASGRITQAAQLLR